MKIYVWYFQLSSVTLKKWRYSAIVTIITLREVVDVVNYYLSPCQIWTALS